MLSNSLKQFTKDINIDDLGGIETKRPLQLDVKSILDLLVYLKDKRRESANTLPTSPNDY